ncbi:AraC family transcriptional regulator [Pseudomonas umsongensis]|jgi:AraC-like DNA-binding protein|uniref:AraC family transcriptional regulator n=1 Tax=Pseudomonas umsongensis TaxID=198618 RepID=UPI0015BD8CF6|nr:AraC family transcriptional regulator [Pseudomonas umsongensis]NWL22416.1 AraC family transcriptional regulator [Pseudomonas umsongensis]
MDTHLIRSMCLYGARELIADLHGDPWRVAHGASIASQSLDQLDALLPVPKVVHFLELAARETGREDFGLLLAQKQGMGVLGTALLDLVSEAITVGDWLERLSRYFHVLMSGALVHLEQHDLGMTVHYEVTATAGIDETQSVHLGLALLARKLRSVLYPQWSPERVMLRCREPHSRASYTRMFGQNVFFNQECNGMLLSHHVLAQPLNEKQPSSRPALLDYLRENQQRRNRSPASATEDSVRKLLSSSGAPVDAVALDQLQSRRTLQRRLAGSGTTFQAIKQQAKLDLARKYLSQTDLKLSQIAEVLGFSSLSAFSRFFHKAQGCAPKTYRAQAAGMNPRLIAP